MRIRKDSIDKLFDETDILEYGALNYCKNATFWHHLHRQIELHYVVSGEVTVHINGAPFTAKKGELIIIKSYDSHYCEGDKRNRLISPILPDEMSTILTAKNIKSQVVEDSKGELYNIMELSKLFKTNKPNLNKWYFNMLTQAILTICRDHLQYNKSVISNSIIGYINSNLHKELSLEQVARDCCTNRCEVSRTVNDTTGHNFNSYINLLRVNKFIELYSRGGAVSIAQIAYEVGFGSLRTFYRAFDKIYNCSPIQYLDNSAFISN